MDKQRSEHIENRFRQAAENFLPPSNDEAWEKMNALLDKDPEKKRAFIWWWPLALLFMMLAGSAGLYYHFAGKPVHHALKRSSGNASNKAVADSRNKDKQGVHKPVISLTAKDHPVNSSRPVTQPRITFAPVTGAAIPSKRNNISGRNKSTGGKKLSDRLHQQTGLTRQEHNVYRNNADLTGTNTDDTKPAQAGSAERAVLKPAGAPVSISWMASSVEIHMPDAVLKSRQSKISLTDSLQQAIDEMVKKEKDAQNAKPARLYVIASYGKNATSLQKFGTKNIGTIYGGELGFHINTLLSVQAGFHAGRKIYFAGPKDYKNLPPAWGSITILKIDANCMIFDLPLSARIDILHGKHRALYAITGLSTFIMNSEDYNYHYNTSGGAYRKSEMKYQGKVDLFSSADFSVGFEQALFKTLYIQAEPYAKLPISGVGAGKVKLYSLGIQLGLKYQPMKKK